MADSPDAPPPARKPWPMTWVAVAIISYIVIYTLINVGYRKDERPHEPAAEAGERKRHFIQATMNGWTRFAVHLNRAGDGDAIAGATATIVREVTPPDLATIVPTDLTYIFPGKPSMHVGPDSLTAPANVLAGGTLRLRLNFVASDLPASFGEALAYAKDNHLRVFIQDDKRAPIDEEPLPASPSIELRLPPGVLTAGEWQATLYAKDVYLTWQFSVEP